MCILRVLINSQNTQIFLKNILDFNDYVFFPWPIFLIVNYDIHFIKYSNMKSLRLFIFFVKGMRVLIS